MRGRNRNPAGGGRPRWPARPSCGGGGPVLGWLGGGVQHVRLGALELSVASLAPVVNNTCGSKLRRQRCTGRDSKVEQGREAAARARRHGRLPFICADPQARRGAHAEGGGSGGLPWRLRPLSAGRAPLGPDGLRRACWLGRRMRVGPSGSAR
jgi:hypothetical protein